MIIGLNKGLKTNALKIKKKSLHISRKVLDPGGLDALV